MKDKIAISKANVANYVPTLMFKTLKKNGKTEKKPNKFRITKSDRLAQSFLLHEITVFLKTEAILNFSFNTECERATV